MDALTQKLIDRAWNADKLRRQKAAIKRTVTSIRNQARDLDALLDHDEREVLFAAARVLDRWTGKAERAFTAKNQTEKAEAKRQASARLAGSKSDHDAVCERRVWSNRSGTPVPLPAAISYLPALPTRLREEMRALVIRQTTVVQGRPCIALSPGAQAGVRRGRAIDCGYDGVPYRPVGGHVGAGPFAD